MWNRKYRECGTERVDEDRVQGDFDTNDDGVHYVVQYRYMYR